MRGSCGSVSSNQQLQQLQAQQLPDCDTEPQLPLIQAVQLLLHQPTQQIQTAIASSRQRLLCPQQLQLQLLTGKPTSNSFKNTTPDTFSSSPYTTNSSNRQLKQLISYHRLPQRLLQQGTR